MACVDGTLEVTAPVENTLLLDSDLESMGDRRAPHFAEPDVNKFGEASRGSKRVPTGFVRNSEVPEDSEEEEESAQLAAREPASLVELQEGQTAAVEAMATPTVQAPAVETSVATEGSPAGMPAGATRGAGLPQVHDVSRSAKAPPVAEVPKGRACCGPCRGSQ